jgi:hypothetical protein
VKTSLQQQAIVSLARYERLEVRQSTNAIAPQS